MSDQLTDDHEVMYRQIHPNYMKKGLPASNRFMPSGRDQNKLSVDRGSMLSPAESHAAYTSNGLQSAAVYGVSVGDFREEKISTRPDPVEAAHDKPGNPAHALADYAPHDEVAQKQIALRLCGKAISRGVLHSE